MRFLRDDIEPNKRLIGHRAADPSSRRRSGRSPDDESRLEIYAFRAGVPQGAPNRAEEPLHQIPSTVKVGTEADRLASITFRKCPSPKAPQRERGISGF